MKKIYMEEAIKQAKKAYKKGEVPVGTIIVYKNKILVKSYNKKETKKNAINHAEIIAIQKACKKLKTWHLENCEIYTTLEPCMMCMGAIIQCRISKIYYATKNNNYGELNNNIDLLKKYNKNIIIEEGLLKKESSNLLKQFFKERRK